MKFKRERIAKEIPHSRKGLLQSVFVRRQKYHVVRITNIVLYAELSFYKLVKRMQVDIGEKLRGQVPERNARTGKSIETLYYFTKKRVEFSVSGQILFKECAQLRMTDGIKKSSYVCLKHPYDSGAVLRQPPREIPKAFQGGVRSFSLA